MGNHKEKTIYLTEEGLNEIGAELDYLKREKRPEVIKALKEARAQGDLSENADYDAARNEQARIEARIKDLEVMMDNAVIIKKSATNTVDIGATVKIKYIEDDEVEEYQIVGKLEADPFQNKISNESPIAKAIIGAKKGDTVTVESPNGEYMVEIIAIA